MPLIFLVIGIPLLTAWGVYYLVAVILAGLRANSGQEYRYPVNIRFVR